MCGITGLANFSELVSLTRYYSAHLRLRHRGRDDEGFFIVDGTQTGFLRGDDTISVFDNLPHISEKEYANVVLGHRRLSIIDITPSGHQPMKSFDGHYVMIFNGEIYNYIELRQELEQAGYKFSTPSDSEVLLTAFLHWGTACFNRFNGMWAIVIYDIQDRRLILSRDRFGVKPLYYAQVDRTLYFGSEVKYLLPFLPDVRMDETRAMEFVVHNLVDHHPETLFQGIYALPPAHFSIFDHKGLSQNAYWHLPEDQTHLTIGQARDQLTELLTSSIKLRLRSDVPIGSLLSGGLDSTTIVCLVRQILDEAGTSNDFDFFSAVFHEEAYSERSYIEDTVRQTGMRIHWIYPDPEEIATTLPKLFEHQEFPFRSLAVFSQWEIMRHVSQTPIIVLLNGQGSDEIFGGYTAHYYALIAEYIRRMRPDLAWREMRALSGTQEISLIHGFATALRYWVKASPLRKLVHWRFPAFLNRAYRETEGWVRQVDIFRNALVRNLTFSALPEYLRYEDRNSMAFTLESRLPFLDYRLVEWAMELPAELKIKDAVKKRVLREAASPHIPASILSRRDKTGFISPQEKWQHQYLAPMLAEAFSANLQERFPFLDEKNCQEYYASYREGRHNEWMWVWRIANLVWWHQHWWEK